MGEDVRRSDVTDPVYLPAVEFASGGYLQEVNRRLLHPLGLALEVVIAQQPTRVLMLTDESVDALRLLIDRVRASDDALVEAMDELGARLDESELLETGAGRFSGVWDCREDPAGIVFGDGVIDPEKARRVTDELNLRSLARIAETGYLIQDVEPPDHVEV